MSNPPPRWESRAALVQALAQLRRPTPCQGPDRDDWTAEDPEARERATVACQPCPVRDTCRTAGLTESWGVWGGRDRLPAPREPGQPVPARRGPLSERTQHAALLSLAAAPGPLTLAQLAADASELAAIGGRTTLQRATVALVTAGLVQRHRVGQLQLLEPTPAGRAEAERLAGERTW